jgi:hypothetical protein
MGSLGAVGPRRRPPRKQQPGPLLLDRMCIDVPDVPLHPAAQRFWRECGYLR